MQFFFRILLLVAVWIKYHLQCLAAADFIIVPNNVTQAEGINAVFQCRHSTAEYIEWSVNGTLLNVYHPQNISTELILDSDRNIIEKLTVLAIREYNGTTIRCYGFYDQEQMPPDISEPVMLLVQGPLAAIKDLQTIINALNFGVVAFWNAPFTLNITDVEPDITYCVDIHNNSDGSHVQSECGVIDTWYNFTVHGNPSPCDSFSITVTPVNGAGNGMNQTIKQYFFEAPNSSIQDISTYQSENMMLFLVTLQPTILCTCGLVTAFDSTGRGYPLDVERCNSRNVDIHGSLPLNQNYNLRLELHNSAGTQYLNISISTHDVQDIAVSYVSRNNKVHIGVDFLSNTTAMGAFIILARLYPGDNIHLNKSIYTVVPRQDNSSTAKLNVTIPNVPMGFYTVLVYDIEENGLLSDLGDDERSALVTPALVQGPIAVLGYQFLQSERTHTTDRSTDIKSITVQSQNNASTIRVRCALSEKSMAQGCIVVVQSTTTMLYERLIVKVLPRNSEESIIDVPQLGRYHVRVFLWTSDGLLASDAAWVEDVLVTSTNISSTERNNDVSEDIIVTSSDSYFTWFLVFVTLSVILILITIVYVMVKGVRKQRQNAKHSKDETAVYKQVNVTHPQSHPTEVIYDQPETLPPQPDVMKPCQAYGTSRQ